MSWWKKLFTGDDSGEVDYYEEGVSLLDAGQYHEALTSFRLALKQQPNDVATLQQIAVAYTRIGMTDEAIKTYRTVLRKDEGAAAAHYGLAFLVLMQGRDEDAARHLREFLSMPPGGPDADRHVQHARETLAELTGEATPPAPDESE